MKHSRHPLSTYYDFLIAFLSPFKLWEIWWQTLYIISRSFIRRQIRLAAEVRSGLLGTHGTQSDQCPLGAGVCEVLKLKSLIRESSRYVFPAWWSLFFGAAGLDSGALFKCLLLFDLLTELHRGSSEWKHKIVQNQGNHIRTRQEKGKLFLDIFCHLFFIYMYCLLFPFFILSPLLPPTKWNRCHSRANNARDVS